MDTRSKGRDEGKYVRQTKEVRIRKGKVSITLKSREEKDCKV